MRAIALVVAVFAFVAISSSSGAAVSAEAAAGHSVHRLHRKQHQRAATSSSSSSSSRVAVGGITVTVTVMTDKVFATVDCHNIPTTGEGGTLTSIATAILRCVKQSDVRLIGWRLPSIEETVNYAQLLLWPTKQEAATLQCIQLVGYGDFVLYSGDSKGGLIADTTDPVWKQFYAFQMSCTFPAILDPRWAQHFGIKCPSPREINWYDFGTFAQWYLHHHIKGGDRYGLIWVSRVVYGASMTVLRSQQLNAVSFSISAPAENDPYRETLGPGYDELLFGKNKNTEMAILETHSLLTNNEIVKWFVTTFPTRMLGMECHSPAVLIPPVLDQTKLALKITDVQTGAYQALRHIIRIECSPFAIGSVVLARATEEQVWEVPFRFSSQDSREDYSLADPQCMSFSSNFVAAVDVDRGACSYLIAGGSEKFSYVTWFSIQDYIEHPQERLFYIPNLPSNVVQCSNGEHFHPRSMICGHPVMSLSGVARTAMSEVPWLMFGGYSSKSVCSFEQAMFFFRALPTYLSRNSEIVSVQSGYTYAARKSRDWRTQTECSKIVLGSPLPLSPFISVDFVNRANRMEKEFERCMRIPVKEVRLMIEKQQASAREARELEAQKKLQPKEKSSSSKQQPPKEKYHSSYPSSSPLLDFKTDIPHHYDDTPSLPRRRLVIPSSLQPQVTYSSSNTNNQQHDTPKDTTQPKVSPTPTLTLPNQGVGTGQGF